MSNYGAVYPRVGGGNAAAEFLAAQAEGLSPRGRGKRGKGRRRRS